MWNVSPLFQDKVRKRGGTMIEVMYDEFLKKWLIAHYLTDGTIGEKTQFATHKATAIVIALNMRTKTGAELRVFTRNGKGMQIIRQEKKSS